MDHDISDEEPRIIKIGNEDASSNSENEDEYQDLDGYKISKDDVFKIINDIFLTNYWCNRKDMINVSKDYIIGSDKMKEWMLLLSKSIIDNISCIGMVYYRTSIDHKFEDISKFLKKQARPVYDILNIGKGKISLCGGAISSILKYQHVQDYDLFFHSDSVDEIDDIFNNCLHYLEKLCSSEKTCKIIYERSLHMINCCIDFEDFYGNVQFIKRVYKTKEQVLFGFDLAPSRLGYNNEDGFFSTICGAMALSMHAFSIDSNKRSTSFGYRLEKYYNIKQYKILLPQLNDEVFNADEKIEIFDNIFVTRSLREPKNFYISYVDQNNDDDYYHNNDNINFIINGNYDKIMFSSDDLESILKLSDDFVETYMRDKTKLFNKPSTEYNISKEIDKHYLGDKYKSFASVYFINEDDEKSDQIWEEQTKYYIDIAKKCASNLNNNNNNNNNYYKGWKYLKPSSKYFGQNYPVDTPPSVHYKSLIIGINNERFQALMDCRKNIEYITNLPKELFNLICEYWLKYEVEDAKNRLLNLNYDSIKK